MREIRSAIIAGATGAIGTALCRLLSEKGIEVYALVRPESIRTEHLKDIEGVRIIECGLENLKSLSESIKDIHADAFFHLAWTGTTGACRNDMTAQVRNIQYTLDAVHVAKELDCSVFVGAGSQAEYGRVDHALAPDTPCFPENGYGMAKLCAGQMSRTECEKLGIDHIWPRIMSIYGPHDGDNAMIPQVINRLLAGEKPALTAGEQIWDYLYADDAAEALYRLALSGKNGAVYPVGSGIGRPLHEYIDMLRNAIDPDLPLGYGELPYGGKQVMHLKADISSLKEDIGFEPSVGFEEGIRKTIAYERSKTGDKENGR